MPSADNTPPRLQHLTSFHILLSFSRNCKTFSLRPQTASFPRGFSYSGETNLRRMVILGTSYGNSASLDSLFSHWRKDRLSSRGRIRALQRFLPTSHPPAHRHRTRQSTSTLHPVEMHSAKDLVLFWLTRWNFI